MKLLERVWVRLLIYGVFIAVIALTTYRLAYRHSGGPHPVDSGADIAFMFGLACAAGMSVIAMFIVAAVEGVLLLRRPSDRPTFHEGAH